MVLFSPLPQLHDLDRTSSEFCEQLNAFFRGDEYRGVFPKLQCEELAWLGEYLDSVLVGISDHAGPAFQLCLHELGKIAGAGKVLPKSCTLPESLLECTREGTFDGPKVRIKRVKMHPGENIQKSKEIAVMSKYLKHPNIVPLLGVTIDPLELIFDRMPGGDLPEYIANHPDADRLSLLSNVAEGLNYLHSCDVIHGDLKGLNILVDAAGQARITNIGIAMTAQDMNSIGSAPIERGHSTQWIAPEILGGRGTYSKEADIFSFAGVAIEAFTGAAPFSDRQPYAAISAIITIGERPPQPTNPTLTDDLWALIQRCWNQEVHLRPHTLRILCDLSGIPVWKRLADRSLTSNERISLITDIFSDRGDTKTVQHLLGDDAQSFVEVIDETLDDLVPWLRRKCLTALCKICGRQAFLPRSVQIPLCYDRTDTPLYRGGYADVWNGEYEGREVAVKVLTVYATSDLDKITQMFCKEVITWKALCHQNVLPLLGATIGRNQFAMVSEWMTNGNINEFVEKHMDVNRFELLEGVARGLVYMHEEGMIHGDLKGANILIDEHGHACLADFGFTAIVSDPACSTASSSSTTGGTMRWMSPERLDPVQFGIKGSGPTKESDCYALGMVILEALTGRVPFTRDFNDLMVMNKVLEGERPGRPEGVERAWFTDDLWVTLQVCWSRQPNDRPTIDAVLECLTRASKTWQPLPPSVDDDPQMDSDESSSLIHNDETKTFFTKFPPVTNADLLKLGIEPQLIPFVVSTAERAEQSSNGEPQLTSTEAGHLVEILDKVVSSNVVNATMKNRCFKILRKVSPVHGILPGSYYLPRVTLSDNIPYASGGYADNWKGQMDGRPVCIKAFRTQTAANLGKIKRRFYREIIAWKYVTHPNVVPFSGVSETLFSFCFISPWLPNGNILQFTRKNERVNLLQLLAQAACGLEYLHSLGIVHSDVNPGNILISEDGTARLGDFGITVVITDPTVVEPGDTSPSMRGVVRYMAPELLNPSQFKLLNSDPTRESDIYSFAVTAYEVLTGTLPYGNARDGIIIFQVVTGDRPPRPENVRWLPDQIWDMIVKCWSEHLDQRWDIRSVYNQLAASSIQEVADGERAVQSGEPISDAVENPLPHRQKTSPPSSTRRPTPKKRFTFPNPYYDPQEPEKLGRTRTRKPAFRTAKSVRTTIKSLRLIFRRKSPA